MRHPRLITGAVAVAVIAVAAAPRAWRRLRGGADEAAGWESDYATPEEPVDEAATAALREELREKVEAIADEAPTAVEADLIVEGVPGGDPATEAARARLREKAQAAKERFKG
jgi:hypothetical protein